MGEHQAYRFRWSNVDLDDYVESRKAKAQMLRRDAATLLTRAEAIEEAADTLKADLEEVGNAKRTD